MNKRKEAVEILQSYANSLKEKGLKLPEIKDDKQLALLAIGWLEDEFENKDFEITAHSRHSVNNVPAFDKRFVAAQCILQDETRKDDIFNRNTSYHAYYYGGKKIAESTSVRKLVKQLKRRFKGKFVISEYSVINGIQRGELEFNWGYLEVHHKGDDDK